MYYDRWDCINVTLHGCPIDSKNLSQLDKRRDPFAFYYDLLSLNSSDLISGHFDAFLD